MGSGQRLISPITCSEHAWKNGAFTRERAVSQS